MAGWGPSVGMDWHTEVCGARSAARRARARAPRTGTAAAHWPLPASSGAAVAYATEHLPNAGRRTLLMSSTLSTPPAVPDADAALGPSMLLSAKSDTSSSLPAPQMCAGARPLLLGAPGRCARAGRALRPSGRAAVDLCPTLSRWLPVPSAAAISAAAGLAVALMKRARGSWAARAALGLQLLLRRGAAVACLL